MKLYDVKDTGYKNYVRGLSLANKPISFYTKNINHISVGDVLSMGEETYKRTMLPFMLSKDFIFGEDIPNVGMLDILTDESFNQYQDDLIFAISLVLNVDIKNVKIVKIDLYHKEILIEDKNFTNNLYIDNDKFEELKSIVLFINNLRELKKTDKEKDKFKSTDEYNKRLEIFYKGKEEYDKVKTEKSNGDILNMFDFLVHFQNNIDYNNVLQMNLYQFYNSIKICSKKEDFMFTRDIYSSGQISLKGIEIPKFLKIIIEDN